MTSVVNPRMIRLMLAEILALVLVLLAVGVLLCAAAAVLMAWALVHPPRMTDGKALWVMRRLSPEDVGLAFEDVEFHVRDQHGKALKIAAWWIPNVNADGRCAVLVHGYADAKVGAIAWAPVWHALGFNLLVPDLRAHGESGGTVCTGGYFERDDLRQVLDELRASRPEETRQLVLFGVSMGGAVAAAASENRADVAAVILESPYADFRSAAAEHMVRLGLPGRWLRMLAIAIAGRMTGADFAAVAPESLVAKITCPVLVIESESDSFLSERDRALLAEAIQNRSGELGPSELWTVEDAEHLMVMAADPKRYQDRLARFLELAMRGNVAAVAASPARIP